MKEKIKKKVRKKKDETEFIHKNYIFFLIKSTDMFSCSPFVNQPIKREDINKGSKCIYVTCIVCLSQLCHLSSF